MLLVGDLSGIQDYLLDIADQAGGQSRRLRARSFFLQIVAEIAALRLLRAAGWPLDRILLRAAGKFILQGPSLSLAARQNVEAEGQEIARWLLEHSGARVRLSLLLEEEEGTPQEQYHRAMQALQQAKCRPLSALFTANGIWDPSFLILDPITPPCAICQRRRATQRESDADNQPLSLCVSCALDLKIGAELPRANWMVVRSPSANTPFDILGLGVKLESSEPAPLPEDLCLFSLSGGSARYRGSTSVLLRPLSRYIPREQDGSPFDFDALAAASLGAPYLGILKMDADSLGKTIQQQLQKAEDLQPLAVLSARLDDFFAWRLDSELAKPEWASIYTIFSGGDDLLLVGPWNVLFDYAFHVHQLFRQAFADLELTISAGMAIVPRKTPIRRAVEQADRLLDKAKTEPPEQGRNQFATLGQVWKWEQHERITHWAKCLARWVSGNAAERGWLQTLLQMTEAREKEPLTTARLVSHVERNYPRSEDRDPNRRALRKWIDQITRDFDAQQRTETRYLPAILRYALMATRTSTGEQP